MFGWRARRACLDGADDTRRSTRECFVTCASPLSLVLSWGGGRGGVESMYRSFFVGVRVIFIVFGGGYGKTTYCRLAPSSLELEVYGYFALLRNISLVEKERSS